MGYNARVDGLVLNKSKEQIYIHKLKPMKKCEGWWKLAYGYYFSYDCFYLVSKV